MTDGSEIFAPAKSREERLAEASAELYELKAACGRTADKLARLKLLRPSLQCHLAIHEIEVALEFLNTVGCAPIALSGPVGVPGVPPPHNRPQGTAGSEFELQEPLTTLEKQLIKRGVYLPPYSVTDKPMSAEDSMAFPEGRFSGKVPVPTI